jgi:hypothetical protein
LGGKTLAEVLDALAAELKIGDKKRSPVINLLKLVADLPRILRSAGEPTTALLTASSQVVDVQSSIHEKKIGGFHITVDVVQIVQALQKRHAFLHEQLRITGTQPIALRGKHKIRQGDSRDDVESSVAFQLGGEDIVPVQGFVCCNFVLEQTIFLTRNFDDSNTIAFRDLEYHGVLRFRNQ